MRAVCESCGSGFETKSKSARTCSIKCRQRLSRSSGAAPVAEPADEGVYQVTLAELRSADRENSSAGRTALMLARRLDTPTADTGASIAALVREHAARLEQALRGVKIAGDPLDELKAMRDRKLATG